MKTLAAIILALLKAIPALEGMFDKLLADLRRQREATATQRKQQKDTAVDEAINRPRNP